MTVFTRAGFERELNATTVNSEIKHEATRVQDAIWDKKIIGRTVEQLGPEEIAFDVRGRRLTAEVDVHLTPSQVPADLTKNDNVLLHEIDAIAPNYVGAGDWWWTSLAFGDNLRLGAIATGSALDVTSTIYGHDLTVAITATPT